MYGGELIHPKRCKVKTSGAQKEGLPGGKWEMDVKMRLSRVSIRAAKSCCRWTSKFFSLYGKVVFSVEKLTRTSCKL